MVIPFHADVLGNMVYCLSKTSVLETENNLCQSGNIRVVGRFPDCWFLHREFLRWWYEDRALGWW